MKSALPAVSPVTATSVPGTAPIVRGITRSRRVCRAVVDAAFSPSPCIGIVTSATVPAGLAWTENGPRIWPVADASCSSRAMPARIAGVFTDAALTTTTAGAGAPGNAAWMRSYVATTGIDAGRLLNPGSSVRRPTAGSARATSAPAEATSAASGRRLTAPISRAHIPGPARRVSR